MPHFVTNGAGNAGHQIRAKRLTAFWRKWLDLASKNFTATCVPDRSTITPDMTPLTISGRRISRKDCRKCRLPWLRVTFLQNGLCEAQLFHSLPAAPVLLTFVQYLIAFSSRMGATIGIISGVLSGWFAAPVIPHEVWALLVL